MDEQKNRCYQSHLEHKEDISSDFDRELYEQSLFYAKTGVHCVGHEREYLTDIFTRYKINFSLMLFAKLALKKSEDGQFVFRKDKNSKGVYGFGVASIILFLLYTVSMTFIHATAFHFMVFILLFLLCFAYFIFSLTIYLMNTAADDINKAIETDPLNHNPPDAHATYHDRITKN